MSRNVPLNIVDHGGDGVPVVLLHGGGRDSGDWSEVAAGLLRLGYRPVALDLRGHGLTPVAPWTWELALGDVAAVISDLGLDRPAVVGHSLGGMIAALWAVEEPACPLAMNIDGHGNPTRVEQFDGMPGDRALAAMSPVLAAMGAGLSDHLRSIMAAIDATEWTGLYRDARCPLLITRGQVSMADLLPDEAQAAWRAYEAWTERALREIEREHDLVEVVFLPTAHDSHREMPEVIVSLIHERLATSKPLGRQAHTADQ